MADAFADEAFEVQVTAVGTNTSHVSSMTFGGRVPIGELVSDHVVAIRDTYEVAMPDLLQDMAASYQSDGLRITWQAGPGDTTSVDLPWADGPLPGGESGSVMDPRAAYILRKKSVGTGRRGCGRTFIPGVVEEDVEPNGHIEAARFTTMINHANSFMGLLLEPGGSLEPFPLGVNGTELGGPNPVHYPTAGVSYNPVIGLVRRRLG